jgi:hypothetical protein
MPTNAIPNALEISFSKAWQQLLSVAENRPILWDLCRKETPTSRVHFADSVGPRTDLNTVNSAGGESVASRKNRDSFDAIGSPTLANLLEIMTPNTKVNHSRSQVLALRHEDAKWSDDLEELEAKTDPKSMYMRQMVIKVNDSIDKMMLNAITAASVNRTDAANDGGTVAAVNLPSASQSSLTIGVGAFNRQVFSRIRSKMGKNGVPINQPVYSLISWEDWEVLFNTETELLTSKDFHSPEAMYYETGRLPSIQNCQLLPHDRVAQGTVHSWWKEAIVGCDFGKGKEYLSTEGSFRGAYVQYKSFVRGAARTDDNGYLKVTIAATP